jgi:hypothetical protein
MRPTTASSSECQRKSWPDGRRSGTEPPRPCSYGNATNRHAANDSIGIEPEQASVCCRPTPLLLVRAEFCPESLGSKPEKSPALLDGCFFSVRSRFSKSR